MYCALHSFLRGKLPPSVRCSHQLNISPALVNFSSSFRRSFLSWSLMYCALHSFLRGKLHPSVRCSHQLIISPALVNFSSSPAHASRYLSSATCMTSLRLLHAFRNAQREEPPAKAPGTAAHESSSVCLYFQIGLASPYSRTSQINRTVGFGLGSPLLRTTGACW